MYEDLCRLYRGPDEPRKENYASKPSKGTMGEHVR